MGKHGLDASAIRLAVRIASRLELDEGEIRSLVRVAMGLETSGDRGAGAINHTLSTGDVRTGAKVLAVVRAFQAFLMTGRDREQALTQIKRRAGSHLDHEVVGTLLTLIREDAMAAIMSVRCAVQRRTAAA